MPRSAAILPALAAMGLLAACGGDPLANMKTIGEVDVAGPAPVVEAVAAPAEIDENVGFFERLRRKRQVTPGDDTAPVPGDAAADEAAGGAPAVAPEPSGAASDAGAQGEAGDDQRGKAAEPSPRRRGWLAALVRPRESAAPEPALAEDNKLDDKRTGADVQRVALSPAPADMGDSPDPAAESAAPRGGLFSRSKAARLTGGGALRDVVPGEVLPFGEVGRACHVKRAGLGREVAKYPERGAKYRVYDSAPGHVGLHTFYVTGFKDGCPRQVTAALAVFGTAGMYEALRYGLPVKARSKKPTDQAYEKVKSRVCGVARSKPCGGRISRIEKTTVFLSLYNRFEGAQGWTNLLLSDGRVMARDTEG